ncbi:alpha/beta fold hydrolase [Denitrobaculum tricleocarpae]
MACTTWTSSSAGLTLLKNGWPLSNPNNPASGNPENGQALGIETLLSQIEGLEGDDFNKALTQEVSARLRALLDGIQSYRSHPYRRDLEDPPSAWQEGSARLLDFGLAKHRSKRPGAKSKPAVLVVPSLINRSYVLDLSEKRSLCRWLAGQGFRPFLMDWGAPNGTEQRFGLSDYTCGYLERALDHVLSVTAGRPPVLLGYCMGGLLTLALAQRRAEDVSGLALLATPWDFHAGENALPDGQLAAVSSSCLPLASRLGYLPVDTLQSLFALLDPMAVTRKFVGFSKLDPDSQSAREFVAVEDWINDGVPLAAPVAGECLEGWYRRNLTARGEWEIDGEKVRPEHLDLPCLAIVPAQDRIVPPGSALALCKALRSVELLRPRSGHVGMVVGQQAREDTWQPLAAWLSALAT